MKLYDLDGLYNRDHTELAALAHELQQNLWKLLSAIVYRWDNDDERMYDITRQALRILRAHNDLYDEVSEGICDESIDIPEICRGCGREHICAAAWRFQKIYLDVRINLHGGRGDD